MLFYSPFTNVELSELFERASFNLEIPKNMYLITTKRMKQQEKIGQFMVVQIEDETIQLQMPAPKLNVFGQQFQLIVIEQAVDRMHFVIVMQDQIVVRTCQEGQLKTHIIQSDFMIYDAEEEEKSKKPSPEELEAISMSLLFVQHMVEYYTNEKIQG